MIADRSTVYPLLGCVSLCTYTRSRLLKSSRHNDMVGMGLAGEEGKGLILLSV